MESNHTQWLVDIELIKQLKARYYRFNDTQDWASFHSLFLDDAIYDSGNHVLEGPDRIVETFASGLAGGRTAHMAGLPEIEITSADTARAVWAFRDYIELASDKEPVGFFGYGHEHDEYVRTADGWKIAKVTITRIRVDPLAGGLPSAFGKAAA